MKLRKLLLFVAVFATAAITGCKEDPIIEPVEVTLSQLTIAAEKAASNVNITLMTNRDWTIEKELVNPLDGETDTNWATVSPEEGGASTSPQTITIGISANADGAYEREMNIYFRTESIYAVLNVHQDGVIKPSSYKYISIADLRAKAPADKTSSETVSIKDALKVKAIVTSSASPQTVSSKNLFIQDSNKENGGILIYTNAATIWETCKFGDSVDVILTDGSLVYYNQLLEFLPADDANITIINSGNKVTPATITGEQMIGGKFEGQYVKLYAQVRAADLTKTMGASPRVETKDIAETFLMYSRASAGTCPDWASTTVPQGAGDLYGLVSSYSGVYQLVPQSVTDFSGLTGTRFSGEDPDPEVTTGDKTVEGVKATLEGSYTYAGSNTISEVGIGLKLAAETDYTYKAADAVAASFSVVFEDLTKGAEYNYIAYVIKDGTKFFGTAKTLSLAGEKTISVADLFKYIEDQKVAVGSKAELAAAGDYFSGIVAAVNGEGNNLYKMVSVVDGDGAAKSGIIMYDSNLSALKVGDKIKVSLANAKVSNYQNLYEIVWDAYADDVTVEGAGYSTVVPEITPVQLLTGNYQGMYVKIVNVKSNNAEGATWYSGTSNYANTKFVDADGNNEFTVRNYKTVPWKDNVIKTGVVSNLYAVAQVYGTTIQVFPSKASDVAGFNEGANLSVANLVTYIKALKVEAGKKADLKDAGSYFEGIVAAINGEGNNLFKMVSVVDGDGYANSGIIIYDSNVSTLKVGDKIKVSLAGAQISNYSNLREIVFATYNNDITVLSADNATVTPNITAAQFLTDNYQGMYVKITNVKSNNAEGATWYSGTSNYFNTKFVDQNGENEFAVRNYKTVPWKDDVIKLNVTGAIGGVAQINNTTIQIFPNVAADVADFK